MAEKKEKFDKGFPPVWSVPFQRQDSSSIKVFAPLFLKTVAFLKSTGAQDWSKIKLESSSW
jgi:hypothetical protein